MNKSGNYIQSENTELIRLKSFTVRDLPKSERPRERLIELGADKLSSPEIISLILNTGSKGESVMMLSQKLIMHFGSLKGIMQASFEDLRNVKGLGEAKASKLMACFEIAKRASKEERDFSTLTFAIDEECLKDVKEILTECRRQIQNRVQESKTPDRVMHLNLNLFPTAILTERKK